MVNILPHASKELGELTIMPKVQAVSNTFIAAVSVSKKIFRQIAVGLVIEVER